MLSEIVTSKQLDKMAATVGRGTEAGLCEQKIYFSLSSAGAILRDIEGLTSNLHYHHQLLTKGMTTPSDSLLIISVVPLLVS